MRIMTQSAVGGPEVLQPHEAAVPEPGPGEVRVCVGGIGVNPVDTAVRAGYWPILGEPPFTLGWDVAGSVDAVGPGVTTFEIGERVFGLLGFPASGATYAEFVIASIEEIAETPDALTDAEAAAIPLAGLTAYQALVEVADVRPGQRVLVQAAGGGVGHLAVQIAKARGAEVVATASPAKVPFVRGLGADDVRDYTAGEFSDGLDAVDVVLDPFGGDQTITALRVVRDGGTVVSLLDFEDTARQEAERRGIKLARILVHPDGPALEALAVLAADGRLTPHVSAQYPLEKAGDAHREFDTGVQGKVVLVP
jgi:NADPH:quinone reductase-like Zn-dependent oxidoreductase